VPHRHMVFTIPEELRKVFFVVASGTLAIYLKSF